ncbi:BZ3500_MvSof-1268-A1-R1_Chr4-1g06667 [Microbotryum saponariae]|uniref:BZ3500_MvSof-1268-A1-R1_Chr4-1g06667 protein n=1 Tax=Microbotryum saponariae TaxID=289078 RepID=A0A2X0MVP3_9BASI|nr:BZ3500_MvSof-1268-A1-R1_Chr4-1g06667 [Microbotryum saponariae]SDA06332.1 BZ3501_MvSof-1269-A2-R1_Chr4-1g06377 [Microbotryum saponariae]
MHRRLFSTSSYTRCHRLAPLLASLSSSRRPCVLTPRLPTIRTMSKPHQRLNHLLSSTGSRSPSPAEKRGELLGTLKIGDLSVPVYEAVDKERCVRQEGGNVLDFEASGEGAGTLGDDRLGEDLVWMCKKYLLGQDMFLYSPPGPYARRLALTFAHLLNRPFEIVSLHRDVGESELKQGREIRGKAQLVYTDSSAVRAAKLGSLLILDGIERCERGVLPTLNNLLENREINLEDGTHIVSADRYDLMVKNGEDTTLFIPAHRDFRVIAIGTPVPPFPGYPLDPPFRSRFQARYLDPLATCKTLAVPQLPLDEPSRSFVSKCSDAITTLQYTKEMRAKMASGVIDSNELPSFPQTALWKLARLLDRFPPPVDATLTKPAQVASVLMAVHPALAFVTKAHWRSVEEAFVAAGLGDWVTGLDEVDPGSVGMEKGGFWGWELDKIERVSSGLAKVSFVRGGGVEKIVLEDVAIGARSLTNLEEVLKGTRDGRVIVTARFVHLLTTLVQLHALGSFDLAVTPPSSSLQSSSSSTNLLIDTFAGLMGYELETLHLYKELSGREIWMRRVVSRGASEPSASTESGVAGTTTWEPSLLTQGAWEGKLVHLEGIDTIGSTVGSLGRLLMDREAELWEGQRMLGPKPEREEGADKDGAIISRIHPSFRIIATSSKSSPPKEWLTEELSANFIALPSIAMSLEEEKAILLATGCTPAIVDRLEVFARAYRRANAAPGSKSRRLGTASLVRIATRLSKFPGEGLFGLLNRTLLSEFLPNTAKEELWALFKDTAIAPDAEWWNPPPEVKAGTLVFPAASDPAGVAKAYEVRLFDLKTHDALGSSYIPYMNNFLDNSQQTALMRDIAVDLELLGEHVLLLGNQGVGKNKIVDRMLQLLDRPREFVQLHRDTTTQSLQFKTSLEGGVIRYVDSPLLRAVALGRVIVIDEVDKAAAPVVASLASLAARGEMTLADGRKIRPAGSVGSDKDIIVHPNFRIVLLANRPGTPFLGNPFLRVLGDTFSTYAVTNPDIDSEQRVLAQLAPELDEELLRSLVQAFGDLRKAFDSGALSYPFSLRELLAIVRHLKRYPDDTLEEVLRNVFDFDTHRPETIDKLYSILRKYKLGVTRVGLDAVRGPTGLDGEKIKKTKVIEFEPKGATDLSEPKFGKGPDGKLHVRSSTLNAKVGGNKWAGGTGGRSTAGLGGRGGAQRLAVKGQDIHQIPDSLKADVPDHIKQQARDMARKELAKRLADIDLTSSQASQYSGYHDAVQSHVQQLVSFLDNLEANEEERVWLKRQTDGELDESRLSEALTQESTVYKRRGMEKPELGRPQLKPKRIRFVFDCSASMYRNQYTGGLTRSLETAVMVMEAFARISRKEKYRIDLIGHSGEEVSIPLVPIDTFPAHAGERYKVIQKMALIPQFCWAGDNTVPCIEESVQAVAESDSDDYFCIVITDANLHRYGITPEDLKRAMTSNSKVKVSLVAIGEGAESEWLPKVLPGRCHAVKETADIATTLRSILGSMLTGEL